MPALPGNPWFISCDETFGAREGTPYAMGSDRNYVRTFQVVVRVKELDPLSVCLCPGLPLGGSFYVSAGGLSFDELALLVSMEAKEAGPYRQDWQVWVVTCHYSTNVPTRGGPEPVGGPQQGSQNQPDVEHPFVAWDSETVQEAIDEDWDGNALTTSAGQPFITPPTFPVAYRMLDIRRNELGYDSQKQETYSFALNNDTFLRMPPSTVQCLPPKAEQKWKGSYGYWSVSYRLKFARKLGNTYRTLQPRVLDQGTMELIRFDPSQFVGPPGPGGFPLVAAPQLVHIYKNGQKVTHPVLLDGSGRQAKAPTNPDGTPKLDANGKPLPIPAKYRQFRVFADDVSFRDLLVKGLA
jgi:hypothetical protein